MCRRGNRRVTHTRTTVEATKFIPARNERPARFQTHNHTTNKWRRPDRPTSGRKQKPKEKVAQFSGQCIKITKIANQYSCTYQGSEAIWSCNQFNKTPKDRWLVSREIKTATKKLGEVTVYLSTNNIRTPLFICVNDGSKWASTKPEDMTGSLRFETMFQYSSM